MTTKAYEIRRIQQEASSEIARLQAQVDAAKSDASLMRSIHAQAMESNGRTIASHLGTIQDLRAQVEALAVALREIVNLCAVGDVDESTEALGWGAVIKDANAALAAAGR